MHQWYTPVTFSEVPPGFEPGNEGFADPCLTTWPRHRSASLAYLAQSQEKAASLSLERGTRRCPHANRRWWPFLERERVCSASPEHQSSQASTAMRMSPGRLDHSIAMGRIRGCAVSLRFASFLSSALPAALRDRQSSGRHACVRHNTEDNNCGAFARQHGLEGGIGAVRGQGLSSGGQVGHAI